MDPRDRFSTRNQRIPGWAAVCLAFLLLAPAPGWTQSPGPGAPPALGKSPRDRAVADSLMNHYVVKSPHGRFEAHGDAMLRRLRAELRAIDSLRQTSRGAAFGGALKNAVTGPFEGARDLVTRPGKTLKAAARGLAAVPARAKETLTGKRSIYEDNLAVALLSVSKSKREFASAVGVDVYSRNRVLQKELESVAWAEAAGGLGAAAAVAVATFSGSLATSNLRRADEMMDILRTRSASELRIASREALERMGVADDLIERFLDHRWYSPRHEIVITANLLAIEGAAGRDRFIERALCVNSEEQALFFQQIVEMMRGHHQSVAPIERIEIFFGIPLAHAGNGEVAIFLPIDHLQWTGRVAEVAAYVASRRPRTRPGEKLVLWLPGTLTERARDGLEALGIDARERIDAALPLLD
jgi:hypothetical protein